VPHLESVDEHLPITDAIAPRPAVDKEGHAIKKARTLDFIQPPFKVVPEPSF
jgi:hypothetical protein